MDEKLYGRLVPTKRGVAFDPQYAGAGNKNYSKDSPIKVPRFPKDNTNNTKKDWVFQRELETDLVKGEPNASVDLDLVIAGLSLVEEVKKK